jgi:hypothetical protein
MSAEWPALILGNTALLGLAFVLERLVNVEHLVTRRVVYDRVDLLPLAKRDELKADLEERVGVEIVRIEVGNVDLLRDTAVIKIATREELHSDHTDPSDGI